MVSRYGPERTQRGGSGKAKVYYTHGSWRQEAWHPRRATWKRHRGGQEAEDKNEGNIQVMAFPGDSTGKARQGRVNCLGLASLNFFSRLWALRVVPRCLAPGPGPGMIKAPSWDARVNWLAQGGAVKKIFLRCQNIMIYSKL